jgi:tetratricopeptide (TPR) repeat protein
VGKTRLARELLASLEGSARVLAGRCEPYGEGITYLPLAQALRPALGDDPRAAVHELLAGDERVGQIADEVAAVLGADEGSVPGGETFWAVRRLLEELARERTLVLVVDDVHWAEPMLLDCLEYLASFSRSAPILVLCLSRPDLLEERPTWALPRENAVVAVLAPLGEADAASLAISLADRELDDDDLRRVLQAADGNPLFLEQLVALNTGPASEELVVPPTIQALLAARIDRLEPGERTVLECAAVEGRAFRRAALLELLPEPLRIDAGAILLSLVRRQLVRALPATGSGVEGFSFVHSLLRDAAYAALPKEVRADLHLRLADHLERRPHEPGEVVGNHLLESVRYRRELGLPDERTSVIARRGAELLSAGGLRALELGDDRSAAKLLEGASELVPVAEPLGRTLRIELGRALAGAGRLDAAREAFTELGAAAREAGERSLELRADLGLLSLRAQTDASLPMADVIRAAEDALPRFEADGDERGLARAWFLVHWAGFRLGRCAESIEAAERVVRHSARARDPREQLRALGAIAMATFRGPMSVEEVYRRCDELVERAGRARLVEAFAERVRGGLCSLTGAFDEGRAQCARAVEIYDELGHPISAIGVVMELQQIERQAGRHDVAERELRSAYARLAELDDIGYISWVVADLARTLAEQGRFADALEHARIAREELQRDLAFGQVASRVAEAQAFAAGAGEGDADATAAEALELVRRTDMLDLHADVLALLAGLARSAGRDEDAARHARGAIELYERKGNVVSARRLLEHAGAA